MAARFALAIALKRRHAPASLEAAGLTPACVARQAAVAVRVRSAAE